MKKLKLQNVQQYVNQNIEKFHKQRLDSLDKLKLNYILKRKNIYLFRAKDLNKSCEIVRALLDAHLSSNEETIFGNWLEELAIFINSQVFGGRKSSSKGIDLEFENDNVYYIVAIKSGPNWGNSSQISKMKSDFTSAKKTLRTSNSKLNVIAVNGCCYGIERKPDKGEYFKYCGSDFWKFISNNDNLFLDIVKPLGTNSQKCNKEFEQKYEEKLKQFTLEFEKDYCNTASQLDWNKLIEHNSKNSPPKNLNIYK